ncbi:unnamed protein product [Diabrotica balteata]|uniref:Uncharacterized protein n=1 Tax=Diabrotica balteata TaxID=107213 RepID=A0A9N9X591_DIABA|nr:unnamed protein product [Diabrotica balteata]
MDKCNTDKDPQPHFDTDNNPPGGDVAVVELDFNVNDTTTLENLQQSLLEKSPEKYIPIDGKIPTPFKKALFWPDKPCFKETKKRVDEVPTIVFYGKRKSEVDVTLAQAEVALAALNDDCSDIEDEGDPDYEEADMSASM